MRRNFGFFNFVVLILISEIFGETLIISSNGTINSICDEITPCSIDNAFNQAKESDILFFQEGTYNITQNIYINVGNLTLLGQSKEKTIFQLLIERESGINSTFPLRISNFTFVGLGNFNFSTKSNAIFIHPLSSNSSFPFNISTIIENISFNGNFTGLASLIECSEITTPFYFTNIFFEIYLNPILTSFFLLINSNENIIINQITSNNSELNEIFSLKSTKNLFISNLNITNGKIRSIFDCNSNSTFFNSIFIQFSNFSYCPFIIKNNFDTEFNHLIYLNSSSSVVGIIFIEKYLNFYLNESLIDSSPNLFSIYSFSGRGNINIENSEFIDSEIIIGPSDSISLTNNYFHNIENYLTTQSSNTIIKNCTFEDLQYYEHLFMNTDQNYLYISDSQFMGDEEDPLEAKISLQVYYTQQLNQTIEILFEESSFINLTSPIYLFNGAMNVTFNNCKFEGLENPWISSCPSNGSTIFFLGDQTELDDENVVIADENVVCNLYCSANFDVICERGADENAIFGGYFVWIFIGLFVVFIILLFGFVGCYFLVRKKFRSIIVRSSYDSLPDNNPLN